MKPNLDQKHGWQAKRSLDNELYRNVELEVWEDSKNGIVYNHLQCDIIVLRCFVCHKHVRFFFFFGTVV